MAETSTKPYMIRAIYEWCCDNGYTPYLAVKVDGRTLVPVQHVRNGEIVLNISPLATNAMQLGNDLIEFQARFNGVPEYLSVPVGNVLAIYARETGSGMAFSPELEEGGFDEALEAESGQQAAPPAAQSGTSPESAPAPVAGGEVLAFARPNRGAADAPAGSRQHAPAAPPPGASGGSAAPEPSGASGNAGDAAGAPAPSAGPVADAPQPASPQPASPAAQPEKAADVPRVGQNKGAGPDGGDEPPPAGGGGRPRLVRVK